MRDLPKGPFNLPPGVTLNDLDPLPRCIRCGEEFSPQDVQDDMCRKCQREEDEDDK